VFEEGGVAIHTSARCTRSSSDSTLGACKPEALRLFWPIPSLYPFHFKPCYSFDWNLANYQQMQSQPLQQLHCSSAGCSHSLAVHSLASILASSPHTRQLSKASASWMNSLPRFNSIPPILRLPCERRLSPARACATLLATAGALRIWSRFAPVSSLSLQGPMIVPHVSMVSCFVQKWPAAGSALQCLCDSPSMRGVSSELAQRLLHWYRIASGVPTHRLAQSFI